MRLPYSVLELRHRYPYAPEYVFNWWTELEPRGYVGRRLKSVRVIERTGVGARVVTEWSYLGFSFKMPETLEIKSDRKWIWYSSFLGIPAVETFSLKEEGNGCELTIHSEMRPRSPLRKLLFLIVGWNWRREDRLE
ncbi:MAG: hypothetical protein QXI37_03700, partial [Thermoprotei archaeon]